MSTPLHPRSADPYRDLDVIDERGPRTNQVFVGVACLVGFLAGAWWLVALVALQLAVGLVLGRRWCVPCRLWFDVLQPRLGEGRIEDARAPRFANQMGLGVLAVAGGLRLLGYADAGWALALVVAALALLSVATGFCMGCAIFRVIERLRGREACEICVVAPVESDRAD